MMSVRDHLAHLIAAEGPLSIAEFMRTALTAPGLGYYMRGDPFGAEGDFVTAPDISQIFGELIGLWSVATWAALGAPPRFSLVELGPGRGTLMSDALRAARVRPAFLEAANVALIEIGPALRARQRQTLKDARVGSLAWFETVDEALVADRPLILVANEFFDALPVRQFVATDRGWCERCVGLAGDGTFAFARSLAPIPDDLIPRAICAAPQGSVFEFAPARNALAKDIAEHLARRRGAALVIDYGFSGPGVGDTLQAVKAHGFVPVLDDPGHADLTTHVDFDALATGFAAGGADVYGPLEQSAFLQRLGARERTDALAAGATGVGRAVVEAGFARLTEPAQMGSLFKTLVAASPGLPPPGFVPHERR